MKKIIHIISSIEQGGSEVALLRLLTGLAKNHDFRVIVLNERGHYATAIEALGIPIDYLAIRHHPIRTLFKLMKLLKKNKPDIVQTWLYHADFIGGLAAKLSGVKQIIWGIRCEGIGLKKTTAFIQTCCAFLSHYIPTQIITNSLRAAQYHIHKGYAPAKFKIIYNGFDSKTFYPNKTRPTPERNITIGTLARFHPDKDYETLIQAINIICPLIPTVQFIFCGKGCHPQNQALIALIHHSPYKHHIQLIDGVDNPNQYLNSLDIFIQSSKTESFSNSLAEAMLCGIPCIATDVGETSSLCNNHAIIVPKENPEQLALACVNLIHKTETERLALADMARLHVKQQYSIEAYRNNFQHLYELER